MRYITSEHFRELENSLNALVNQRDLSFSIDGKPDEEQLEMHGYVSNWILADGKYRARIRGMKPNLICLHFNDPNYLFKLNYNFDELESSLINFFNLIDKNRKVLCNDSIFDLYNSYERNSIASKLASPIMDLGLQKYHLTIQKTMAFNLDTGKLGLIFLFGIVYDGEYLYSKLKPMTSEPYDFEYAQKEIDNFYKDKYFSPFNKTVDELSEEEKTLIKMSYY